MRDFSDSMIVNPIREEDLKEYLISKKVDEEFYVYPEVLQEILKYIKSSGDLENLQVTDRGLEIKGAFLLTTEPIHDSRFTYSQLHFYNKDKIETVAIRREGPQYSYSVISRNKINSEDLDIYYVADAKNGIPYGYRDYKTTERANSLHILDIENRTMHTKKQYSKTFFEKLQAVPNECRKGVYELLKSYGITVDFLEKEIDSPINEM